MFFTGCLRQYSSIISLNSNREALKVLSNCCIKFNIHIRRCDWMWMCTQRIKKCVFVLFFMKQNTQNDICFMYVYHFITWPNENAPCRIEQMFLASTVCRLSRPSSPLFDYVKCSFAKSIVCRSMTQLHFTSQTQPHSFSSYFRFRFLNANANANTINRQITLHSNWF